jgi:hypothetical protein
MMLGGLERHRIHAMFHGNRSDCLKVEMETRTQHTQSDKHSHVETRTQTARRCHKPNLFPLKEGTWANNEQIRLERFEGYNKI